MTKATKKHNHLQNAYALMVLAKIEIQTFLEDNKGFVLPNMSEQKLQQAIDAIKADGQKFFGTLTHGKKSA